jgi:hypothetical protein
MARGGVHTSSRVLNGVEKVLRRHAQLFPADLRNKIHRLLFGPSSSDRPTNPSLPTVPFPLLCHLRGFGHDVRMRKVQHRGWLICPWLRWRSAREEAGMGTGPSNRKLDRSKRETSSLTSLLVAVVHPT